MFDIVTSLKAYGVIPVIKIEDPEKAAPLAKALIDGGLPLAEITFRTKNAHLSIARMREAYPFMVIGAGTVLTTEQVDKAMEAGAEFVVAPGLNPVVVKYCGEKGIPILPGAVTPSEIELAMSLGLKAVKFFPAEQAGGLSYIKAVSAPYQDMMYVPTGGIDANNLGKYLAFNKIIACGGSWMVKEEFIMTDSYDKITELTKQALAAGAR